MMIEINTGKIPATSQMSFGYPHRAENHECEQCDRDEIQQFRQQRPAIR